MSSNSLGLLNNQIDIYTVFNFIKDNIDSNASFTNLYNNKSYFINFTFKSNNRNLLYSMNSSEYQDFTKINETITYLGLGFDDDAIEILTLIVKHFGGWLVPNDTYDDVIFYDFNYDLVKTDEITKNLLIKLESANFQFKTKLQIVDFIKTNLDFIKKL